MNEFHNEARVAYQQTVAQGKQCLERFVEDFLARSEFHDAADAYSKAEHKKNFVILSGMLKNRPDLIIPLLQKESEIDIEETTSILQQFDTDPSPTFVESSMKTPSSKGVSFVVSPPFPGSNLNPKLTEDEINLIVKYVNEVFLVYGGIGFQDFKDLLNGNLQHEFVIKKTYALRMLFEYLSMLNQIDSDWMTLLSNSGKLLSPSSRWKGHSKRPLVRQDLYSSGRCLDNSKYEGFMLNMHEKLKGIRNLSKE